MATIIKLDHFKRQQIGKNCFKYLNAKFRESYNDTTTVADLSDSVLLFLANPDEKSTTLIYQLIQFVLFPKGSNPSHPPDKKAEIDLMDIHLYLVDKIRFEIMRRLDWIESYPGSGATIIDLIIEYEKTRYDHFKTPPQLSKSHKSYDDFINLTDREKETFVRRFFLDAMVVFSNRGKE